MLVRSEEGYSYRLVKHVKVELQKYIIARFAVNIATKIRIFNNWKAKTITFIIKVG